MNLRNQNKSGVKKTEPSRNRENNVIQDMNGNYSQYSASLGVFTLGTKKHTNYQKRLSSKCPKNLLN